MIKKRKWKKDLNKLNFYKNLLAILTIKLFTNLKSSINIEKKYSLEIRTIRRSI